MLICLEDFCSRICNYLGCCSSDRAGILEVLLGRRDKGDSGNICWLEGLVFRFKSKKKAPVGKLMLLSMIEKRLFFLSFCWCFCSFCSFLSSFHSSTRHLHLANNCVIRVHDFEVWCRYFSNI